MHWFGFPNFGPKKKKAQRLPERRRQLGARFLDIESLERRNLLSVTVNPITGSDANSTFSIPSGKDLYVPITGVDAGETISYTASSSDPNVQVSVLTGNPTLQLDVAGTDANGNTFTGTMTFQLFENIAPATVQGIINKVNAGLYDGSSFYRMETGSSFQLIQGGIEKTSGKSDTTVLPDEFNVDATYNSGGLLAMASSGPDTATSEFFVTGPSQALSNSPQFLNFGYTIFGQLVTGQDIYNDVLGAPTTSDSGIDYANTPVTITSATIITDTQNAVLQISEPNNYTGSSTITVVGDGSDGTSAQQTFTVNSAPVTTSTQQQPVALGTQGNVVTTPGQAVSITVSASDFTGATPTFNVGAAGVFNSTASYTAPSNVTVQVTPGSGDTATITLTPVSGFTGTVDLVLHADDSSGYHDAEAFSLTVGGPLAVNTATAQQHVEVNTTLAVTGVSISDPGASATDNVTATFAVAHGTLTFSNSVSGGLTSGEITGNGADSVTVVAPLAAINATLADANGLKYTPRTDYGGSDTLSILGSDTHGNNSSGNVALQVAGPLTLTLPTSAQALAMNNTLAIGGVSLTDPGLSSTDTVTLTLAVSNGALALSTSVNDGLTADQITDNGTGSVTIIAPLAAINATLADPNGLKYTPTTGFNGSDTLAVSASDSIGNSNSGNVSLAVGLTITAPAAETVAASGSIAIPGISLSDSVLPDSDNVTLTLGVTNGALTLLTNVSGGLTDSQIVGNGMGSVVVTAPLAAINATLGSASGLTYVPTAGFNGADSLTLSASDPLSDLASGATALTVVGPLTIASPSAQQITTAGQALVVGGVSLTDPSLPATSNITWTLSVVNGTLTLSTGVSGGLSSSQITGNGSGSVTVTAPLAAINTTLADAHGLTYTPTSGVVGEDTLSLSATDPVANSDSADVSLLVVGPLTFAAPNTELATPANAPLVITNLSITDPGLPNTNNVTVAFTVTHGAINLSTNVSGGLTDAEITGNGSESVTIVAPLAAIKATLADPSGLTYAPDAGYNGAESLDFTSDDALGNSASASVAIAVGLTINAPVSDNVQANGTLAITGVSLVSPSLSSDDSVTFTPTAMNGTLTVSTTASGGISGSQITGNGSGSVTIVATLAEINATFGATNGFLYTPSNGYAGADSLNLAVSDPSDNSTSTSTSVGLSVVGPLAITVPSSGISVKSGGSAPITGVSIADPGSASLVLTVKFAASNGTIDLSTSVTGGITSSQVATNGTGSVTVTATQAEINDTLTDANGLVYTPNSSFNGSDSLTINGSDTTGNSEQNSVPLTIAGPIAITVPTSTQIVKTGGSLALTGVSLADPSLPVADLVTFTLSVSQGSLSLSTTVSGGLTSSQIASNGSDSVTITAPLAAINATLADPNGLTYTPTSSYNGPDTLSLSASDTLGNSQMSSVALAVAGPLSVTNTSTSQMGPGNGTLHVTGLSLSDTSYPSTSNVVLSLIVTDGVLTPSTSVSGGITSAQITGSGTGSVTITAPLAAINATLADSQGLIYAATPGFNGVDTLDVSSSDSAGNSSASSVSLTTVGPITVTVPTNQQSVTSGSTLGISGVSLTDPSYPTTDNVTLTLTATNGVLTLSTSIASGLTSAQISGNGTSDVTITAPLAAINATLTATLGLSYTPNSGFSGGDSVTIAASDASGNSATQSVSVTVSGISTASLSGIDYEDANGDGVFDAGDTVFAGVIITLTGTDSQGNSIGPLSVKSASDGSYAFQDLPAGTYTLTKTEPDRLIDAPATVGSLQGSLTSDDVISSISVTAGANGSGYNFGEGGIKSDFVTLNMFLNTTPPIQDILQNYIDSSYADTSISTDVPVGFVSLNNAPSITATKSSFGVNHDTAVVITGVSVADNSLASSSSNVQFTLGVTHGVLNVSSSVSGGVTSDQLAGNGTSSVTITAPLAAINATLADANGLSYTPSAGYTGVDLLSLNLNDQGQTSSGVAQSVAQTLVISVVGAPTVTVPSAALNVGQGDTLSITGASVADSFLSSGASNVQLNLTATQGVINIASNISSGVTSDQITGNGTANVVITATLGAINATFAATGGLTYASSSGFTGSDSASFVLSDLGNTASGSAQTTTQSVSVNVSGSLTVTAPTSTQQGAKGNALAISDVSLADPSLSTTGNVTVTFAVANGTISLPTSVSSGITTSQVSGNGSSSVTINAPLATLNATLADVSGLTYTPNGNYTGADSMEVTASDTLGHSNSAIVPINVAGPLTISTPSADQKVAAGGALPISGVSLADPSLLSSSALTLTLDMTNGAVALSTSVSGGVTAGQITGNGTNTVTINAPLAAINATLADAQGLVYTPTTGFNGAASLSLSAGDGTGNTPSASISITVVGPLSITAPTTLQEVAAGGSATISGVSLADPSLPTTDNVTVKFGVTNGTVAFSTTVSGGVTEGQITGNGTNGVTITASLAAINATLADAAGLVYTPTADISGPDSLSLSAIDTLNNVASSSVSISVGDS